MDNHVHLLMTPSNPDGVSLLMKNLGQRFVQFVNRVHKRTGALWEGRYYSSVIDSGAYLFTCYRYIEMNPVRARMVATPGDFPWSSYRTNAEGERSAIVTPHRDYLGLGEDEVDRARIYRTLFSMSLGDAGMDEIRKVTRGGYAFGSEEFKKELAAIAGRAMAPQRIRGLTPKPPLRV